MVNFLHLLIFVDLVLATMALGFYALKLPYVFSKSFLVASAVIAVLHLVVLILLW